MNPDQSIDDEYNVWSGDENNAWSVTPQTVGELWNVIGQLAFAFGSETKFVWRGMSRSSYSMTSTLYRALDNSGAETTEANHQAVEQKMLQKARKWGLGHTRYGQATDLQLLAELQHHGFPTRLIDVTVNPMTALWFACSENPDEPGRLVAIAGPNMAEVETSPTLDTSPTAEDMDRPLGAQYRHHLNNSEKTQVPFLVNSTVRDARMNAQEGLFIASSVPAEDEGTPFPSLPVPESNRIQLRLRKALHDRGIVMAPNTGWGHYDVLGLEISPEMKQRLLPVLENTFNRSARTIYPDMDGFVRTHASQLLKDLQEDNPRSSNHP